MASGDVFPVNHSGVYPNDLDIAARLLMRGRNGEGRDVVFDLGSIGQVRLGPDVREAVSERVESTHGPEAIEAVAGHIAGVLHKRFQSL